MIQEAALISSSHSPAGAPSAALDPAPNALTFKEFDETRYSELDTCQSPLHRWFSRPHKNLLDRFLPDDRSRAYYVMGFFRRALADQCDQHVLPTVHASANFFNRQRRCRDVRGPATSLLQSASDQLTDKARAIAVAAMPEAMESFIKSLDQLMPWEVFVDYVQAIGRDSHIGGLSKGNELARAAHRALSSHINCVLEEANRRDRALQLSIRESQSRFSKVLGRYRQPTPEWLMNLQFPPQPSRARMELEVARLRRNLKLEELARMQIAQAAQFKLVELQREFLDLDQSVSILDYRLAEREQEEFGNWALNVLAANLKELFRGSCVYPGGGSDWSPLRQLTGVCHSYVYLDYAQEPGYPIKMQPKGRELKLFRSQHGDHRCLFSARLDTEKLLGQVFEGCHLSAVRNVLDDYCRTKNIDWCQRLGGCEDLVTPGQWTVYEFDTGHRVSLLYLRIEAIYGLGLLRRKTGVSPRALVLQDLGLNANCWPSFGEPIQDILMGKLRMVLPQILIVDHDNSSLSAQSSYRTVMTDDCLDQYHRRILIRRRNSKSQHAPLLAQ